MSSATVPARTSLVAAGGLPFLITSLVGRLPASTLQLGLLMFVTASGLGFGLGGLTVAAAGLGTAFGAPVVGRLVDRIGAFPVVAAAIVLQTLGLVGVLLAVQFAPNPALIVACAALIGAANPQIGPVARGRWSTLARERNQPDLIRLAMGYEGACDEAGFVVGPAAAGLLVGILGPVPALIVLIVFVWVGEGVFLAHLIVHRDDWRPAASASTTRTTARMDALVLAWPLLACLSVGMVFGSTQTALTAAHAAAGTPGLTGLVYGCVGIGSAIVSILIVRLVPVRLGTRIGVGGIVVAGASLAMMQVGSPAASALVAVVVGAAVGAIVVSAFAAIERIAPTARINQAMTFGATSLTLGVSAGALLAGNLVDVPAFGFVPAVAAGLIAVLAGTLMLVARSNPAVVSAVPGRP